MKKTLSFAAFILLTGSIVFSCTKSDPTKNYTCNCTVIKTSGGVTDTSLYQYPVTTTADHVEAACNQSLTQSGVGTSATFTCTYN